MIPCVISLVFLVTLANCALVYPPGWNNASESLEEFRVGDRYIINPWEYHQRLGLYKIMVQQTEAAFRPFGPNNTENILWGLPLQFGWQFSSGRTRDMTNSSTCGFQSSPDCVSPKNWWASMNYYLSVVPFLGMVNAGFFQVPPSKLTIKSPLSEISLYCTNFTTCDAIDSKLIELWTGFFSLIKNSTLTPMRHEGLSISRDDFLRAMWKAHVNSISVGLRLFANRLQFMSEEEQAFGQNWANLVSFIASTLFATNNANTTKFQKMYLPDRMLCNSDHPPNVPGLSTDQNKALVTLSLFYKANKLTGGMLLSEWEKAMCSPETRAVGRHMMGTIIDHPYETLVEVFRVIKLAGKTC